MTYKPRPLTIPLVLLAVYFFVILNITGLPKDFIGVGALWEGNAFGWPNEYLSTALTQRQEKQLELYRQDLDKGLLEESDNGFVEAGTINLHPDSVRMYSAQLLLLNVAVCLAMVLLGAFVAEYWQRLLGRPHQVGLRTLFLSVAVAAAIVYLMQTALSTMWYFEYWDLLELVSVSLFLIISLATVVLAIYKYTTAKKALPQAPDEQSAVV